ncbi:MAG: hemolysin III family protein [Actinomycetota bacterium]|nr:hemolysin III family protein [Actinomycetota bacterium]
MTSPSSPFRLRDQRARPSGTELAPRWRGILHLCALAVALPASVALMVRDGINIGVVVYVLGLIALYAISAGYHLLPVSSSTRVRLRQADRAMIYLFIAASATPFFLLAGTGWLFDLALVGVWLGGTSCAVLTWIGIMPKGVIGGLAYLVLGWLAVITLPQAIHNLNMTEIVLFLIMGLMYSVGAGVLGLRWPDPVPKVFGYHEVWHAMVVLGSACYFVVVWSLASPHHG